MVNIVYMYSRTSRPVVYPKGVVVYPHWLRLASQREYPSWDPSLQSTSRMKVVTTHILAGCGQAFASNKASIARSGSSHMTQITIHAGTPSAFATTYRTCSSM